MGEQQKWHLKVLTNGDTLRQERLTRDLHAELLESPALETGFLEEAGPDREGRKGAGGEVALWVLGAATARPASQVLITLIKEWSTRERHRRVEISYGDDQVTLTGRPDDAQERLVREFLDRIDRRNRTE